MKIFNIAIFRTAEEARQLGAINYGTFFWIFPGYIVDGPEFGWIPASDLLFPLEMIAELICMALPGSPFVIGDEIGGGVS